MHFKSLLKTFIQTFQSITLSFLFICLKSNFHCIYGIWKLLNFNSCFLKISVRRFIVCIVHNRGSVQFSAGARKPLCVGCTCTLWRHRRHFETEFQVQTTPVDCRQADWSRRTLLSQLNTLRKNILFEMLLFCYGKKTGFVNNEIAY